MALEQGYASSMSGTLCIIDAARKLVTLVLFRAIHFDLIALETYVISRDSNSSPRPKLHRWTLVGAEERYGEVLMQLEIRSVLLLADFLNEEV